MSAPAGARNLTISEVARSAGVGAGTIRMWEQRHGFPAPHRTASGHRRYGDEDVEAIRRVAGLRRRGLSMSAAIERARESEQVSDHPSIYAAVVSQGATATQVLRKRTLVQVSRAIEHEALARAASPVVVAAFQREHFYRQVSWRYDRLAQQADATVVFADFGEVRHPEDGCTEMPIGPGDVLGNEWAVVVDAPGYAATLLGWEQPGITDPAEADGERRFECIWTTDPRATRRAAAAGARLCGRIDAEHGARLQDALDDRPLATEEPAPALTALTNRMMHYLDEA